jgi:hypothetical protein
MPVYFKVHYTERPEDIIDTIVTLVAVPCNGNWHKEPKQLCVWPIGRDVFGGENFHRPAKLCASQRL